MQGWPLSTRDFGLSSPEAGPQDRHVKLEPEQRALLGESTAVTMSAQKGYCESRPLHGRLVDR